jgi:hypothetical protein
MWGAALALGSLAAGVPGVANAKTETFAPVRTGRYTDQDGTHSFVEFEPHAWAQHWRVEGFGKPSFGGETSGHAYALLRATYTPPGNSKHVDARGGFRLIARGASSIIPGDLDGNGKVDIFDYNTLLTNFGKHGRNIPGDINHDRVVDLVDYDILQTNFGKTFEVQRWGTPTGTIDKEW